MTSPTRTSAYDQYAEEYAAYVATREQTGLDNDPFGILPVLLAQLGDVAGQVVLDAGCGEGYLSRVLAARGAHVTGVDLAPRLVELAGLKPSPGAPITYRVGDLSEPHPELAGRFDAVASYFVLNDVDDHRGFAETLARSLRSGGRAVLGFNNPYDYVMRKGLGSAYFQTGAEYPRGLAVAGVPVFFYHRTLPQYLDAFLDAGLYLAKIVDVDHPAMAARRAQGEEIAQGEQLPRFMVLAFKKP
jgi:2-polyprenyl-3-methyl-5-hydroxy-6-metoxy-1,4-benzoquinol methylase